MTIYTHLRDSHFLIPEVKQRLLRRVPLLAGIESARGHFCDDWLGIEYN